MEVELSSGFKKSFGRLPAYIQEKSIRRMKIFEDSNAKDSRLEIHKLQGDRKEEWAYSVDDSYRIAFIFLGNNKVLYTDVGTHDQVY